MVDLKELERRLDAALAKETKESLNNWLDSLRVYTLEKIELPSYSGGGLFVSTHENRFVFSQGVVVYTTSPPIYGSKKETKKDSEIYSESFFLLLLHYGRS